MRILFLICLLGTAWGCQAASSTTSESSDGQTTQPGGADSASAGAATLQQQRQAFLNAPEFVEHLPRLLELEQQALQLAVDEPLKLGSIGTAILDIYPGSQTGHLAMSRFYAHVESDEAKTEHDDALAALQAQMGGDGSVNAPFKVMTIYDAHAYAESNDTTPVGSIYQINDPQSFELLLVAKPNAPQNPEQGRLQQVHFDLSHMLSGFGQALAESRGEETDDVPLPLANPWELLRTLAARMDTAAQTAIGRYLGQMQKYSDAVSWLRVASRAGNVLANSLLARIYWSQAEATDDESKRKELRELSLDNHLHAIALGSTDSMYTLANLYINDYYGEENRSAAIPLLQQAGQLGHAESLLYLGYLHNIGREVEQDIPTATSYFEQAAALNNPQAIISYGRFLSGLSSQSIDTGKDHSQIHEWLGNLAQDDNAEAMVVLGNLHARGIGTRASHKRAIRWYKQAVKAADDNADIVNEVAWTLTVSDVRGLKRARYAKKIMDNLMADSEAARTRPEFLDTWAAAHAASGDFSQAIALQQEAIEHATSQERDDVLDILKGHLEQFKAGATITESAP